MQALIIFVRAGRSRNLFFSHFRRILPRFNDFPRVFCVFSIFSWILRDFHTFSEAIRTVFLFSTSKLMHFHFVKKHKSYVEIIGNGFWSSRFACSKFIMHEKQIMKINITIKTMHILKY